MRFLAPIGLFFILVFLILFSLPVLASDWIMETQERRIGFALALFGLLLALVLSHGCTKNIS